MTRINEEKVLAGQPVDQWNGIVQQKSSSMTGDTGDEDDRHKVAVIELSWPQRLWMATRQDIAWLADRAEDAGHRYDADIDDIRWQNLGAILTEISHALTSGNYEESAVLGETIAISIHSSPVDGLTRAEFNILNTWIVATPRGDPSSDQLFNAGVLWNVWKHAPQAILPIRSDILDYADDVDSATDSPSMAAECARVTRISAAAELKKLTTVFALRSPLYVAELARATTVTAH